MADSTRFVGRWTPPEAISRSLEQAATRLALRIAELVEFGIPRVGGVLASVDEAIRESLCATELFFRRCLTDPPVAPT